MISTYKIAERLYSLCYDVEKNIVGLNDIESELWAKHNSIRHANTVKSIIDFCLDTNKSSVKVLNASGLSSGHQDFSIVNYWRHQLQEKYQIELENWVAFEHPNSHYLNNTNFQNYIDNLSINLKMIDFSQLNQSYKGNTQKYDIILFTEIAEHLDHSTFIRCLSNLNLILKDDGILILSTPNLANLRNRVRLLFGHGDLDYWGDGQVNREKGLFGHIVYYDISRLSRLLKDSSFTVIKSYTYNPGSGNAQGIKKIISHTENTISRVIPKSGKDIFIIAKKGQQYAIPFKT